MLDYGFEIMYDNGIIETYQTGEVTEEKALEILNLFYEVFRSESNGVVQFPNEYGSNALIALEKVTRVSVIPSE